MLANTMNVEISSEPGTDPQHGMDNVQLSLLSNVRHHQQLAEFQAASQAETTEINGGGVNTVVVAEPELGPAGPIKAKKAKKTATKEAEEPEEMFDESDKDEFRKPHVPAKKKGKKKN